MKISVVIPSYGQAEYLEEAIQSVLSQTSEAHEVIVVDDGSTDGSLEIAKRYEPRVKVISQINKGLASARNTGIMNATGDYIFFLDADDKMLPNCLKVIHIYSYEQYDVIAPSIHCFGKAEQDVILMQNPTFDDFKEGNRLAYCQAIKREVLLEVGGYSPRMDMLGGWEDLHLTYDLMRRGKKIVTTKEPLVAYRTKDDSMWTKAEKNKGALWAQLIKDFPEVKDHAKS